MEHFPDKLQLCISGVPQGSVQYWVISVPGIIIIYIDHISLLQVT